MQELCVGNGRGGICGVEAARGAIAVVHRMRGERRGKILSADSHEDWESVGGKRE